MIKWQLKEFLQPNFVMVFYHNSSSCWKYCVVCQYFVTPVVPQCNASWGCLRKCYDILGEKPTDRSAKQQSVCKGRVHSKKKLWIFTTGGEGGPTKILSFSQLFWIIQICKKKLPGGVPHMTTETWKISRIFVCFVF